MPSPAQDEIMPRWAICVNELFRHGGFLTSSGGRVMSVESLAKIRETEWMPYGRRVTGFQKKTVVSRLLSYRTKRVMVRKVTCFCDSARAIGE